MAGEHIAQAADLLAQADRIDTFPGEEPWSEWVRQLQQEALVHAVLAVAEEIANYSATIAER